MIRALLLTTLLTAAAHAAEIDRTLQVSAAPDLYVATGSGRIQITAGPDSQVHVRAHVRAGSFAGGDVQNRIQQISQNPPIRQSGNVIHIGDVDPEQRRLYNNITIDYEIAAPRTVALNLRSGSGDVEVDNLGRFLKAITGSGSVRAHGVAGPTDLQTGSGDVELNQSGPGEVHAQTGSGSIRVHGLAGGLNAHTGSGDIEADGTLSGPAHLDTGSGSIRVHIGPSAHYSLDAGTGSGTVRYPGGYNSDARHVNTPINGGGPTLHAQTGSGDIQID